MFTGMSTLTNGEFMVIVSLIAGVLGTGIGGILGVILKGKGQETTGKILAFAGGVMTGVVTFEMIPEAVEKSAVAGQDYIGVVVATLSTIAGALGVYAVNAILDFVEKRVGDGGNRVVATVLAMKNEKSTDSRKKTLRTGIVMFFAIALHNFPEGMAIGASGVVETSAGVLVALVIALHDVPEGTVISAPLSSGGVKPIKAILLTFLAGASTVLGAVVGVAVGGISALATGVCMGLAGGAMIYVTFLEILPEATDMNGGELPAVSTIAGIICSAVFVFAT